MSSLQLPKNVLDLADYELGALILDLFIAAQAEEVGIPASDIPDEFAERVVEYVSTLEASSARLAPLEKSLHKAASGEFELAGRLFREDLIRGATELKFVPIGIKKSRQASEFGRRGAESKAIVGEANRQAVFVAAMKILANSKRLPSDRQLARDIARISSMNEETVRGHLKKLRKDGKLG